MLVILHKDCVLCRYRRNHSNTPSGDSSWNNLVFYFRPERGGADFQQRKHRICNEINWNIIWGKSQKVGCCWNDSNYKVCVISSAPEMQPNSLPESISDFPKSYQRNLCHWNMPALSTHNQNIHHQDLSFFTTLKILRHHPWRFTLTFTCFQDRAEIHQECTVDTGHWTAKHNTLNVFLWSLSWIKTILPFFGQKQRQATVGVGRQWMRFVFAAIFNVIGGQPMSVGLTTIFHSQL